ncbi:unnamed protein product [Closterium sp. NIES-64]|nr:unnamed protein product [Closterium sp. NIES-64]
METDKGRSLGTARTVEVLPASARSAFGSPTLLFRSLGLPLISPPRSTSPSVFPPNPLPGKPTRERTITRGYARRRVRRHRPSRARAITRGDVYIVRLRRAPVAVQVSAPVDGGERKSSPARSAPTPSVGRVFSTRMARDGGDVAREGARRNRRKLAAADWGAETRNGRPWFDRSSALIQSLVDTLQDEQNKAESLRSDVRVLQVLRSRAVQKQTSETPALLNLPRTFWSASYTGEDAVIGVVDTGIWPENPSFSEEGYSGFPRSWHALSTDCARTADFKGCSRKLVQASFFPTAFESEFGEIDTSSDWRSPRDADGHGSWVAAAAAGNRDTPMTVARGQTVGAGSGTAPRARIAAYKVFWRSSESSGLVATTADIEQAMDQAVADGCAVILLALGAVDGGQSYFDDLPVLYASMAGTLVVAAAGNGGKGSEAARTVVGKEGGEEEWEGQGEGGGGGGKLGGGEGESGEKSTINRRFSAKLLLSNGTELDVNRLGTINRRFSAKLMLSNGTELDVNGLGTGSSAITNVPIIHSPDAKLASAAAAQADGCAPGTLDPALVNGKLVVCVAGGDVPLTAKVTEAKAKGAVGVVLHSSPRTNQPYARDLPVVGVSARAEHSHTASDLPAPVMYATSSTGPLSQGATTDVFKPDLVAPGAFIWAASRGTTLSDTTEFKIGSGTSVAAAHVAGVAALLMQWNPALTPVQVMSVLTTTANATMDAALAGKILQDGQEVSPLAARDLNRAAIAVSNLQGAVTVTRVVTNLGATATYKASVVEPAGVDVEVTPASFTIETGAANAVRFSVKLTPRAGAAAAGSGGGLAA